MLERPTDPEMEVWRAFLRTHATVIKALEREMLAEQDLPLTWYEILMYLEGAPNRRLRLQALADSLLLSRSGVTRLVDRLALAGLVRREPCPHDRRGSYAVLTEQGYATLQRAAPGHLQGVAAHFSRHLRPEELPVLQAALNRILQAEENRLPMSDEPADCVDGEGAMSEAGEDAADPRLPVR